MSQSVGSAPGFEAFWVLMHVHNVCRVVCLMATSRRTPAQRSNFGEGNLLLHCFHFAAAHTRRA